MNLTYPRQIPFLKKILLLALLLPVRTMAQEPKVHFGLAASVAAKLQLLPGRGDPYNIWGSSGISLAVIVDGTDEHALSLLNKAGLQLDFTQYRIQDHGWFGIDRLNVQLNPEILFPTGIKRIKVSGGVGIDWTVYSLAQLDIGSSVQNGESDAYSHIKESLRKVLPFVSLGILYNSKSGLAMQVFARQNMLNSFPAKMELSFSGNAAQTDIRLNNLPAYLGFSVSYFFN
jgi:hypothetical protein